MYTYTVYGLSVTSEIECPELIVGSGKADVYVRYGQLQNMPVTKEHPWGVYAVGHNQLLLNYKTTARYLVSEGKEIIIDRYPGSDEDVLRLFLLGSAFGAVLHQRGLVPLHGNSILYNGECIVFLGRSGIGKSTLAAAFVKRGYRVLNDDVCPIRIFPDGKSMVLPGFPHVKLMRDVAHKLGEVTAGLRRVCNKEQKYFFPVADNHHDIPAPLNRVYTLNSHNSSGFRFSELDNMDGIIALQNYTYRKGMMKKMYKTSGHFQLCSKIVEHVTVKEVFRPAGKFMLNELVELLEEDFR
ncbi:MAG: hypothetical protein HON76_16730 [Candidatus Scalindua sp.]|jgi:hypothetical protein|nr:hypothetical protein [Candidatus Scalindua sp.]MBT5306170.1 hypothetical protein [Candidatus Scalindua sp.]MBT6230016.1 hypothetical protein [Candidatus Scalindua sp.]MBT6564162.1 hypothetical protein [Candidatus Scalindua sp.]MBT7210060.1 hypothetical protein [Candidatus Scalindua sp.]